MKLGTFGRAALLAGGAFAAAAVAQTGGTAPANPLNIPGGNVQFFGTDDPSVRKATAIVNGDVITGTDVDHRLALIVLANGGKVPADELPRLRAQVLRNLVDESLQIQAAAASEIKVEPRDIDNYYQQYAKNFQRSTKDFSAYLRTQGSSEASIKRQIHGEIAWSRLLRREIEPFVAVGEEEVRSVIERLNAAKGTQEYRIGEIFVSATPETAAETRANAQRIVDQVRRGASFLAYARQFSEASTAAVGGDLGWVRAEQLPEPLSEAARVLRVGQVSDPIAIPGGFSIIAVQDTRQVLTADPRDAVLSLKQLSVTFPKGATRQQMEPKVVQLAQTAQAMGGCGRAEEAAARIGAEVVSSDQTRARDLPPALQEMLLKLNVGQATTPFGTVEDGVRVLVLCGRDDPDVTNGPSFDQVYARMEEERVNRRAQRYLRDLRRDAVVDYR
ncbi:MAG: Periplasmic chaperone and peptidyl-prolyl cis-trans isomerase of outer membrane proteins SurA [uncultured Sphingosinicella sp.]|uniref:Parvulin-like PPIase n=1 Tax=uncultured Sphingosinicella sp. TaxID=478748 RepID=A0A6J4U1Y7_9SPHN|nr:peptidylprolyl isomerase [uncultured Sphingosinicella sp.]CAA9538252.1 MAG: Periplasmic chaperone and peptidyl-prolyl cis-trans isomerase of outer membrane proteins SurA [uncultured Sphingosinicella sp.]